MGRGKKLEKTGYRDFLSLSISSPAKHSYPQRFIATSYRPVSSPPDQIQTTC